MPRKVSNKKKARVVTSNDFITAKGLSDMPLNARKLLYIAIAQCRMTDDGFYEYQISIPEFARMLGVDDSNLYDHAKQITSDLLTTCIMTEKQERKGFEAYPIFQECIYQEGTGIMFMFNPAANELFLNLKSNFSQPLLDDFIRFRSPMTMAIWHLMQREMKSRKPDVIGKIKFYLSLDELREVTGSQDKFKQISEFKVKVLDKAIREINEQCGVVISYTNVKTGKKITGFNFEAVNWIHLDSLTELTKLKARQIELRDKAKDGGLSSEEWEEYDWNTQRIEYLKKQD